MTPTLLTGDFIFVNKFAYGLRLPVINTKIVEIGEPQRGDVVVFRLPSDPRVNYVKRVVGLPGDVVEYHPANKRITINGEPVPIEMVGPYKEEPGTQLGWEQLGEHRHRVLLTRGARLEPRRRVRGAGRPLLHDGRQSGQQPGWPLRDEGRVRAGRQPRRARDGRLDELAVAVRRRTAMESNRQGHRMTGSTRHSQAGITALGLLDSRGARRRRRARGRQSHADVHQEHAHDDDLGRRRETR